MKKQIVLNSDSARWSDLRRVSTPTSASAPSTSWSYLAICLAGLVVHFTIYPFDLQVVITMLGSCSCPGRATSECSQIWEIGIDSDERRRIRGVFPSSTR